MIHVRMNMKNNPANPHSKIAATERVRLQLGDSATSSLREWQEYMRAIIPNRNPVEKTMKRIFKKKLDNFLLFKDRDVLIPMRLNTAHKMAAKAKISVKIQ